MKTMQIVHEKFRPTSATRRVGRLTATAAVVATTLLPGAVGASTAQVCSGRSIRFVSGQTAASDTLSLGQTLPAGVYDVMLVAADSYPDRAASDPAGQQSEIVEVAGIRSRDLADGVESANDITYGTFTASAPFSSVIAYHRASTPGPNSVWVSTFCLTPTAVAPPTVPSTTVPSTTVPSTTVPSTTVPSTTVITPTVPSTTSAPTTSAPTTTAPTTTAPTTGSTTSTSTGSILGPSTTVAPPVSTTPISDEVGDPFGFGEPVPAGPSITDVIDPGATATPSTGTLPLTGAGLGVVFIALALVAAGTVTTAGSKTLDAAGDAK